MDILRTFKQKNKPGRNRKKALEQVMLGCSLVNSRQDDNAISIFKKALDIDPSCAEAHYALGVIYSKKGMNDYALASYTKAAEINPDYKTKAKDEGLVEEGVEENEGFDIVKELKKDK